MIEWVRHILHRHAPPRKVFTRPMPIVRELPETIRGAERVRRLAEDVLRDRNGPIERDVFGSRHQQSEKTR